MKIENVVLIIYDAMGKEIFRLEKIKSSEIKIERKNLQSGIYFWRLSDSKNILVTGKIIIE